MAVELNHTIVWSEDPEEGATFLAWALGLDPPRRWGPFLVVEADNGVSLDFLPKEHDGPVVSQHYAFLIGEEEFVAVFARVTERGIPYYADPAGRREGEINHGDGGRGFYFPDPSGHWLEVLTRPYGSSEG